MVGPSGGDGAGGSRKGAVGIEELALFNYPTHEGRNIWPDIADGTGYSAFSPFTPLTQDDSVKKEVGVIGNSEVVTEALKKLIGKRETYVLCIHCFSEGRGFYSPFTYLC